MLLELKKNNARIQISGLLESRILDSKNIILLSCNEEYLLINQILIISFQMN